MRFALRRLGFFLLTLWAALTINFLLPRLMPGNPALAMMAKFHGQLNPQALKALDILFGINTHTSLWQQYVTYLHNVFTGNFGTSLSFYPASVGSVIGGAIWWTLGLVGVATMLAFVLGTGLGHPLRLAPRRRAGQRPAAGVRDHLRDPVLLDRDGPGADLRDHPALAALHRRLQRLVRHPVPVARPIIGNVLSHALLPAAALLITTIGTWILTMRNTMITTLAEDYVRMARAKGLPGRRIMLDYAARNAILPNLTGFAMSLGFVVGGAILIEYVFNYPGRRLHAAAGGVRRGLPADAGAVPAHHGRGAGGDPDRRHRHRAARPADQDGGVRHVHAHLRGLHHGRPGRPGRARSPPRAAAPGRRRRRPRARWRRMARAVRSNRKATAGAVLLGIFFLVAAVPRPDRPRQPDRRRSMPRSLGISTAHLLGTTAYGQDMFAQVIWGTRHVLIIAFVVGLAATGIAVLVGVAAAYLGGALGRLAQPAHRRAAGHPAVPAADRHRRLPARRRAPRC